MEKFGFLYHNEIELIFSKNLKFKEVHRQHNLFWWDECLGNRIGYLHETYIYLKTQEIRGLSKNKNIDERKFFLNTFLFEYHLEVFYHFFFSTRDILFQIINLYFDIQRSEKIDRLKEFIEKVPNQHSKELLKKFNNSESIFKANELRNSFIHRYTPTGTDYRLTLNFENGKEVLSGGGIKSENNRSFLKNVEEILISLATLLKDLKTDIVTIT